LSDNKLSPKKEGICRIWSVFLSQKWLRIQVSGGAKVAQGGQNISRRAACPPTSRAYATDEPNEKKTLRKDFMVLNNVC